jgi:hypothetical protein
MFTLLLVLVINIIFLLEYRCDLRRLRIRTQHCLMTRRRKFPIIAQLEVGEENMLCHVVIRHECMYTSNVFQRLIQCLCCQQDVVSKKKVKRSELNFFSYTNTPTRVADPDPRFSIFLPPPPPITGPESFFQAPDPIIWNKKPNSNTSF